MTRNICSACGTAAVDAPFDHPHHVVCEECRATPPIPEGWKRIKADGTHPLPGDRLWDRSSSAVPGRQIGQWITLGPDDCSDGGEVADIETIIRKKRELPKRTTTWLLKVYRGFERVMVALDAKNDALADDLRDAMDPIWHRLSDADREELNKRKDEELPK